MSRRRRFSTGPASSRLSRAFTLIELLVVIAILSTLAALLMPALTNSVEMARRTACISNQRQIGILYLHYSGDYHGRIPLGYFNTKQSNYLFYSPGSGGRYPLYGALYGALYQAVDFDPLVFYCPSATHLNAQLNTSTNPWPPGQQSGSWTRSAYSTRPAVIWANGAFPNPFPRFVNYTDKAITADWAMSPSWGVGGRHEQGVNVAYGDASAHWVPMNAFLVDYLAQAGPPWNSAYNDEQKRIWEAFDRER